jgi:hypothetical protein
MIPRSIFLKAEAAQNFLVCETFDEKVAVENAQVRKQDSPPKQVIVVR